jgi:hypothetical protein
MVADPPQQSQKKRVPSKKPVIPPVYRAPQSFVATPKRSGVTTVMLVAAGILTAALSAGAGWLVMQFLMLRPWDKEPPSKTSSLPAETRSPQPFPSTATIRYSKSLDLAPGQSVTVEETLQPNEVKTYRFEGGMDEQLSATLTAESSTFSLLKSDLTPVGGNSQKKTVWRGTLSHTDTYAIQVQNPSASQSQPFQLTLARANPTAAILSPTPTPSTSASPSPAPTEVSPTLETVPLTFTSDRSIQRLNGQLAPAQIQRYSVTAIAGQVLSAAVVNNQAVTLTIRDAAGQPLNSAQNVLNWQAVVSEPGVYQIDVVPIDNAQPTDFEIEVGLEQP